MTAKSRHQLDYQTFYSQYYDQFGYLQSSYNSVPVYERTSSWETGKGRPPRNYSVDIASVERIVDLGQSPNGVHSDCVLADWNSSAAIDASNKAYAKFVSSLGDTSQWAVNLAEYHEAVGMIESRVKQITRFTRKLRKLDLVGAARELGISKPKGARKTAKSFGDLWLEYHFGWEPLVQDIGSAVKRLSEPPPKHIIRGKGQGDSISDVHTYLTSPVGVGHRKITSHYTVLYQALAECTSPLLASANDLGFVNPLSVAWELVPFSFVVDWFANVGQVLNACTDMLGYSITNSFSSSCAKVVCLNTTLYDSYYWARVYDYGVVATTYSFHRRLGPIPGPTLHIKPFTGLGVQRGLTAVSLLLQQL